MWTIIMTEPDAFHILPQGDLVAHSEESDCICGPDGVYSDGRLVYQHYPLDGRPLPVALDEL